MLLNPETLAGSRPSMLNWIAKKIRYLGLPSEARGVCEAYDNATDKFRRAITNMQRLSASREIANMPLVPEQSPTRWEPGVLAGQYERLRLLVDEIGAPMLEQLQAMGFRDEQVSFQPIALTHSDGSGICASFLKMAGAEAVHWKGFDVLLWALM